MYEMHAGNCKFSYKLVSQVRDIEEVLKIHEYTGIFF
eukprot:UN09962